MTLEEAKNVLEQSLIELKAIGEDPFGEHEPSQFSQEQIEEALQVAIDALSKPSLPSDLEEKSENPVPNDLDEAAEEFADREYMVGDVDRSALYKGFWHGAKWQKEQMMKEAVEGKVFMSFAPGHNQMVMADVDLPTNTNVRVIVLPKED